VLRNETFEMETASGSWSFPRPFTSFHVLAR